MTEFAGFPDDFFRFFKQLKRNNNRDWFNENKTRFRESVLEPMSLFIVAMQPRLMKISNHYLADPKPHGGSMFRIYRDTRFSKDRTPYKTHAACQFRHEAGKDAHAPGFYVHIDTDQVFFGGGIWTPPSPKLNKIRDFIADNARAWARIKNGRKVVDVGGIQGDSLKRAPRGFNEEHVHIEDLKRKSFYVMTEADPESAAKPGFVDDVAQGFARAAPLNRFICDALELKF
jgi:uncharacterized protein (TIGR02453 family)